MSMYGEDWEYANSRLEQTIVRLGNAPVFVHKVGPQMVATIVDLITGKEANVDARAFDCQPVPLGYLNKGGRATYIMRMPMRRDWRQGLRQGNFTTRGGFDPHHISNKDLARVIVGEYPTYEVCLEEVRTIKAKSSAWCREFALARGVEEIVLAYKGNSVGKIVDGKPVLNESHTYLKQALEEVL